MEDFRFFKYQFKFLYKAVEALAIGPGDIRDRMVYAGEQFVLLSPETMPESLREQFCEIRQYLTEHKAKPGANFPNDSHVRVTMKRRRTKTAVLFAQKIWSFYFQYQDAMQNQNHA